MRDKYDNLIYKTFLNDQTCIEILSPFEESVMYDHWQCLWDKLNPPAQKERETFYINQCRYLDLIIIEM